MDYKEFAQKVKKSICEFSQDSLKVELTDIVKNNGVVRQGLVISDREETICPTIYLEDFFEEYGKGKPFGSIVRDIVRIYEENRITEKIDFQFFLNYESVRKRVFQKVVNYEKNKEKLKKLPHIRFLDLAVVCYYSYMNDFLGNGTILIEAEHLTKWEIGQEVLFADARKNTLEKLGVEIRSMHEIIWEMLSESLGTGESDQLEKMLSHTEKEILMYVMTLRGGYFGGVCICYQEALRMFAGKCGKSFYILPSSIHELILIPDSQKERPEEFRRMVQEVNAGHVALEEQLSDNVYYFDISQNKISIV